ncbi:unnamed protein product [Adineta ricciae]|uniref:LTD domain-containing protein n=1 Tax=Adineta ricciae TaxID=249248 RepID=A0A814Q6U6_ADIRI|nr:unnamed protein product [Adineta ricciae]CAF1425070.1 unnamed protein product [Adineta ricciae]
MSYDTNKSQQQEKESTALVSYRRNAHFGSPVQYTSSIVINLRRLQNDLKTQHEHEREALNELNQRFSVFVDRVQALESQNSKYRSELANLRRTSSGDSGIDLQWNERYFSARSDLTALHHATLDCESDVDWYHTQVGIYQQLIDTEQQWRDKRLVKLEQELKQAAAELNTLRLSYTDLERLNVNQYGERNEIFKQYLAVSYDLCNVKKQRKKWNLNLETLKSYIAFYKNIRSFSTKSYESTVIDVGKPAEYWAVELDESIKKIRRDFETFYATIYREMTTYYETKMEDLDKEIEQTTRYQRVEYEEFVASQQTLQVEYEKIQYSLTYEREAYSKLELTYSRLDDEYKSLDVACVEQLEAQAKEVQSLQERIVDMAYDINEIQRSKVNLEAEIIIYRYLLDAYGFGEKITVVPQKKIVAKEMTGKFIAKGRKKRSIGIKECAANGRYISLVNYSSSTDVDISRWVIKQQVNSASDIRYTIPKGVRIEQGKELRIYSKRYAGDVPSHGSTISALVQQQQQQPLVTNDLPSWGIGDTIETFLYNQNGEEEASYLQSIELRKGNM